MELQILDIEGKKIDTALLKDNIFNKKINKHLIWSAVVQNHANKRSGNVSTKTRGEVSGGGKKPWKQKGTGRARQGSTRSPIWKGGGVTFGPKPRDFSYNMPQKARRSALQMALLLKLKADTFIMQDNLIVDKPTTKLAYSFLSKIGVDKKKILLVIDSKDKILRKSFANIEKVKVISPENLNIHDVLNCEKLMLGKNIFENMTQKGILSDIEGSKNGNISSN